jgi:hypothetical protein
LGIEGGWQSEPAASYCVSYHFSIQSYKPHKKGGQEIITQLVNR